MKQTFTLPKSPVKRSPMSNFMGGPAPKLTRAAALTDICLVAAWGATIPGLMWLGAVAGF